MDNSCILMCANIPRGIPEDVLVELFCIAGPINDLSIGRSGRCCFIIYEFPEAVITAKEIFKDVKLHNRPVELYDQTDINEIHLRQEQESIELQQREAEFAEIIKQRFDSDSRYRHSPFYNSESMTPSYRQNRGRPSYHDTPNPTYGNNYDPATATRRWNQTPEKDRSQVPQSPDLFKSPYAQPVSRRSYESNSHRGDDCYNSNCNFTSKRRPAESESDHSTEPKTKKSKPEDNIDEQISEPVNLFKDTVAEHAYEEQTRRQFFNSPQKSYRDNQSKFYNSPSTSTDYSNRNNFRDFGRPYHQRNNYNRYENDSRRPKHYQHRDYRSRRN